MIKIEKVRDGYLAHVTSPHVKEEWVLFALGAAQLQPDALICSL